MKKTLLAVTAAFMVISSVISTAIPAFSFDNGPTVRYGAFCRGPYGGVHKGFQIADAIAALKNYFLARGMEVRLLGHDRRFVRADVLEGAEVVDSIVLDSKTGRMRSVR